MAVLEVATAVSTITAAISLWRCSVWRGTARAFDDVAEEWAAKWREADAARKAAEAAERNASTRCDKVRGLLHASELDLHNERAAHAATRHRADEAEAKLARTHLGQPRGVRGRFGSKAA